MKIGLIDVGIGNLGSLRHAVRSQGWDPLPVSSPADFDNLTHLLLPGVGAFAAAMERLRTRGLVGPIREFAARGAPVFGICLGMQILSEHGDEGGSTEGLGLIPGRVVPLATESNLRLPHVGWNTATPLREHPILKGIRRGVDFYFVHSYCFSVAEPSAILAETEYGVRFASIVGKGNVVGVQFHPEKSQANGVRLLDNFCMWDGKC